MESTGGRVRGDASGRSRPSGTATLRRDLAELQRLVRVLERHAGGGAERDTARALLLLPDEVPVTHAEQHLRAISTLLVTLATYRTSIGRGAARAARHGPTHVRARDGVNGSGPAPAVGPNGRAPAGDGPDVVVAADRQLAAAAATYIARDLAARRLTEFTSAEGYRLARRLAALGDVQAAVERLLAEANEVRLHPMPLADPVSHRQG